MAITEILIAEYEKSVAQDLKSQLEKLGYKVVDIAYSGEEAVEKTEKLRPDVVLMNVRLNGAIDGIQTGSYIRDYHDTPIVYVMDYSSQATIRRAGTTGPFGYVFNPFDEKQIFATIETALIRHQLESKLRQSRQWLNTTLTSIGDGVIATDEVGLVRFINPAAVELTGWHPTEAIGKSLSDVFLLVDESSHKPIDLFKDGNNLRREESKNWFEGLLLSESGKSVPVEANLTSIQVGASQVFGMVLVFRDVTQQRATMQEIKRQADRAEALMQVASQLNSQFELQTVLNTICEITNQTFKAAGTVVLLQNKDKATFRNRAGISQSLEFRLYEKVRFEIPSDVLQTLLSREEPVIVLQDVQNYPSLPYFEVYKRMDIKTLAVAALFRGKDLIGRQSQTWVRFPDAGWKVVSAHVSTKDEKPLW